MWVGLQGEHFGMGASLGDPVIVGRIMTQGVNIDHLRVQRCILAKLQSILNCLPCTLPTKLCCSATLHRWDLRTMERTRLYRPGELCPGDKGSTKRKVSSAGDMEERAQGPEWIKKNPRQASKQV